MNLSELPCVSKTYHYYSYVSQGNAATDFRGGGSFNSYFLCRSFLNVTVKKFENWSTLGLPKLSY